ncbi:MAG: tetratricopeptide repeat protein [Gammaproteobacteria bacterium]|nr:tetratricopeptide repeat protein [Gammaproteobacteria bacterium]
MSARRSRRLRHASRRYLMAILLLLGLVATSGWLLSLWMTQPANVPLSHNSETPIGRQDLDQLFELAVRHMRSGEYQAAMKLWHQILLLDSGIAEVNVNMGFTLYELGNFPAARDFFVSAMEQNPFQANAYYGLALVSEKSGDLGVAVGAMRSYIHLAGPAEDERFIRHARSALWEWESQLSSPPTGETPGRGQAQPLE